MFLKFPFLSRLLCYVALPFLILVSAGFCIFSLSLPITNKKVNVIGLTGEVKIRYDSYGVPHIGATNDIDAYFSLGFVHSQNRLWQMEMNRRIASGRLSEILGQEALPSDIFMRTLALRKNAQRAWDMLPHSEKAVLTQYVKGVNAGIEKMRVLPIEFYIENYHPEQWTEIDSLLIMQLMAIKLSGNMSAELRRSSLLQTFGAGKTGSLMPNTTLRDSLYKADLSSVPPEFLAPHSFIGSNSWVIAGKYTYSGYPMLANDPHLANSLPSVFYLAEMTADKLKVTGATFPGLPFVAIGRNNRIAWGVTNMFADTQDIFLEKINPNNSHQYEVDGAFVDMQVNLEKIYIKSDLFGQKKPPYTIEVRRTQHGPLLSDIGQDKQHYAYSLRWTGDDENGGTFKSFLKLNYAQNWNEFNDSLAGFVTPIHNFVYADEEGHIGSVAPGLYPIRNGSGALPRRGWVSADNWRGWIPNKAWPRQFDPQSGIIVAANNNITPNDYPYYISSDWAPDYRAKRIQKLLEDKIKLKKMKLTHEDFAEIQMDNWNPATSSILPRILKVKPKSKLQEKAIRLLAEWDGSMELNSPQALIFSTWMSHFNRLLIEDDAARVSHPVDGEATLHELIFEDNLPFLENVLIGNDEYRWCDYLPSPEIETCDELLLIALDHSMNELTRKIGSNMNNWRWGDLHKAQYPHVPFAEQKYMGDFPKLKDSKLSLLFHRSIPSRSGSNSVNVAPYSLEEDSRFAQFFGPSYRQIMSLENPKSNWLSISTGQSGNIFSPHYDDWLIKHQQGDYMKIADSNDSNLLTLSSH